MEAQTELLRFGAMALYSASLSELIADLHGKVTLKPPSHTANEVRRLFNEVLRLQFQLLVKALADCVRDKRWSCRFSQERNRLMISTDDTKRKEKKDVLQRNIWGKKTWLIDSISNEMIPY